MKLSKNREERLVEESAIREAAPAQTEILFPHTKGRGEHRLPVVLSRPLYLLTSFLMILALVSGALLLVFDFLPPNLPKLEHAPTSAAPLLLIGVAYLSLQAVTKPQPLEFLKRLLLGSAFILWGIDQLLPAGHLATVIGDVVIFLYVADLELAIRSYLQNNDGENHS